MMRQLINVFVGNFLAIHFLYSVCKQSSVQTYEAGLRQLTYEGGDILMLNICICVILGSCCGIRGIAILRKELELFHCLTVLRMSLSVKHERFCNLIISFLH